MKHTMDGHCSNHAEQIARNAGEYLYVRSNSGNWYVDKGRAYDHVYGPGTLAECRQWVIQQIADEIDAEAREAHVASGASVQGWDCQYTIEPGGILRVDGQEIDLGEVSMGEVVRVLRGCYAVLDNYTGVIDNATR